jgi:hypothetical protein
MASIWVVEAGEYSDYQVVGVFSSEANAQLVVETVAKGHYYATVAEWQLDPNVDAIRAGWTPFNIYMLRDGTVEKVEPHGESTYSFGSPMQIWRRSKAAIGNDKPDCLHGIVRAEDVRHAVKIANEKRIQLLALGLWEK